MSGDYCTWFPHYKALMRLAHQLGWKRDCTLEDCWNHVRTLQSQLKAQGHKPTLKYLAEHLQIAVRVRWTIRGDRVSRQERKSIPSLEERIIKRFYEPYKEDIRTATGAIHSRPTITIKRGEPAVKYWKKQHGRGYGVWEESCLDITLPPGWPKLAAAGKHIIHDCPGLQERSLIVEWTPETPPDDLFGPQHQFRAGLARIVQRGVGVKTISNPIIMAEHAGVWVSDNDRLEWALRKLPLEVAKRVSSRLN